MTRILHTADWHLGARLVDHDRIPEQAAFLDWLYARIECLQPDVLLVAGDIFDTANPPQSAFALYYQFLGALLKLPKPCQILILGGNHDSPATLEAPRQILKAIRVRVFGDPVKDPKDCLIDLGDCVLCAVPYLRERDVRTAVAGQTYDEVAAGIRSGIYTYYAAVREAGLTLAQGRPLLATGHLTVAGSATSDSERIIHVGTLGAVGCDCFNGFDYVALGHIHKPQSPDGLGRLRYPGSPITLSFSELGVAKELRILDVSASGIVHSLESIPSFRRLLRVSCLVDELNACLSELTRTGDERFDPWLELTVGDGAASPDLERLVREAEEGCALKVLKILVSDSRDGTAGGEGAEAPTLDLSTLGPEAVFRQRLTEAGVPEESPQWTALTGSFQELLSSLYETGTEVSL